MASSQSFWDRSVGEVALSFAKGLLRFLGLALALLIAQLQAVDSLTLHSLWSFSAFGKLPSGSWWLIGFGAFLILVLNKARRYLDNSDDGERDETVIYKSIGGAIERIDEIRSEPNFNPEHCFSTLLRFIENVVGVSLEKEFPQAAKGKTANISANLMIHDSEKSSLELKYFGTQLAGREKLQLPTSSDPVRPGAPKAFATKLPVYVDDTTDPKYEAFFDAQKDYRSIVSVPVKQPDGTIFAVVNIDSNIPGHFGSIDFIRKTMMPKIGPFIGLIRLERDALSPR